MPGRFYPGVGPYRGNHVHFAGYEPSKTGIAKIAVGPEMKHAVGDLAGHALIFAELIAPNDSNEYQAAFSTDVLVVPDIPYRVRGVPMARWAGRVINSSPHAIFVEIGGASTRDHRVMRRTLDWLELVADD